MRQPRSGQPAEGSAAASLVRVVVATGESAGCWSATWRRVWFCAAYGDPVELTGADAVVDEVASSTPIWGAARQGSWPAASSTIPGTVPRRVNWWWAGQHHDPSAASCGPSVGRTSREPSGIEGLRPADRRRARHAVADPRAGARCSRPSCRTQAVARDGAEESQRRSRGSGASEGQSWAAAAATKVSRRSSGVLSPMDTTSTRSQ